MSILGTVNKKLSYRESARRDDDSNVLASQKAKAKKLKIAKISRRINRSKKLTNGQKKVIAKKLSKFSKSSK